MTNALTTKRRVSSAHCFVFFACQQWDKLSSEPWGWWFELLFPVYLFNTSPSLPTNGSNSSRITDYRAYAARSLLDDGTLLIQMAKHCPESRGHPYSIQKATTNRIYSFTPYCSVPVPVLVPAPVKKSTDCHFQCTTKHEQFKFLFVLEM